MKFFFWVLVVAANAVYSQTVFVFDRQTGQPLDRVNIHSSNPKASAVTNARGRTDMTSFRFADSITFSHIGYESAVFRFVELSNMNFRVGLQEKTISFGEIVISASRWEEEENEAPVRVEQVTGDDVVLQNPQTAADLLGSGGYAYVQKSQMGGGSPMLRGFATNRVLLVVDGVRMNNAIFRTGNLQNVISLDANAMDHTEILFGPGAVLYGSDAIGGVMDFHTIMPRFASDHGMEYSGSAMTRYASANSERTAHVNVRLGWKSVASVTAVTLSDFGDLRAGSHGNNYFLRPDYQARIGGIDSFRTNSDDRIQKASAYGQVNLMQKISLRPAVGWNIEYGWYFSRTTDVPRYDRLYQKSGDDFSYAEWYYGPQVWTMNRLEISRTRKGRFFDDVRLVAALQNYEESRHDRRYRNERLRNQIETVTALSTNVDFSKEQSSVLNIFYGVEAVYNKVGSRANRQNISTGEVAPTNTRYPDGSIWQSYAAYMSVKYQLTAHWILNSGVRASHVRMAADFDTTFFDFPFRAAKINNSAINGSIGSVYQPEQDWQVYMNFATGFRAPNVDDIGKIFESEPGAVVVPNRDLKPEYAYNFEVGTAKTFWDRMKIDFSSYYTLLEDALARRPYRFNGQDSIEYDGTTSAVQAIQNLSRAYVWGIQAGLKWNIGRSVTLTSQINYQQGEEKDADSSKYYPLRHAAPLFGSTHVLYQIQKLEFDFYARYNARMSYDDLSLSERSDNLPYAKNEKGKPFVPGWMTLNLKAAFFASEHFSVTAGVENITDRLYRPFASGISAPGRNFLLSLRYRM